MCREPREKAYEKYLTQLALTVDPQHPPQVGTKGRVGMLTSKGSTFRSDEICSPRHPH